MSKILECGAVVPGCKFVIHGESDEDVMMKASEHARAVHGVDHMSEQLRAQIRDAIRERLERLMLQRGVEIVNPGLVRLVHYEPVATAERVPQTRPDSPSASDGYAAGLIAIGARPSTADLAALVDEVSW